MNELFRRTEQPAGEEYFKVVLSAAQHAALEAACETCTNVWDGTDPDSVREQDALAEARVALRDAERIV